MTTQTQEVVPAPVPDEKEILNGLGALSALGLYIVLLVITFFGGAPYVNVFNEVIQLVTGNVASISTGGDTMLQTIITIVSVVLITLPFAAIAGNLTSGKTESYDSEAMDKMLDKGPMALFSVVALEEIVTRGLFLGLITKVFTGDIDFYAMFIIGNALWAFVHIYNFKDEEEQSIIRVLPQFIAGIAFTYIFVKYGLFAAIMAHYVYNTILLATRKEKMPNSKTFLVFVYYIVLFVATWFLMSSREIGMADLSVWLTENITALSGYNFWDYAIVLFAIHSFIGFLATALLLDSVGNNRKVLDTLNEEGGFVFVLSVFILMMIQVGITLFLNWALSFVVSSLIVRSIVITIALALLADSSSGSALAKATFVKLPSSFFTVAAFLALGFWPAVGLGFIFFMLHYIPNYITD